MEAKDLQKCDELSDQKSKELEAMKLYWNITTFLSPPAYNLLCGVGIANTTEQAITNSMDIYLKNICQKLDLIGNHDTCSSEYYSKAVEYLAPFIASAQNVYQHLSVQFFGEGLGKFMSWTRNEKLFVRAFELLHDNSEPSAAVLASLLLTAGIEKMLGDLFLLKGETIPFLVKDLISSPEIEKIFGRPMVKLLQIFMGPPQSLNLRNILWHGFISSSEMDVRYGFFLLAIAITLSMKTCTQESLIGNVKTRKYVEFSSSKVLRGIFPVIGRTEISDLKELFQNCVLILPIMKGQWQYCLQKYEECRFDECMTLLIPQFENFLRILFSSVNNCPERVITAEVECHFTNLSIILSEFTDDGRQNNIRTFLGDNIMELLLDMFILPEGPRIRDRISHGEVNFFEIPNHLVINLLSVAACVCLKVAADPLKSDYLTELLQIGDKYRTVFHPFAILKKKISELIESLGEWKSCPVVESGDLSSVTIPDKAFLTSETVHACLSVVGETFQINHLVFRFVSYSEGLNNFGDALQMLKLCSLYRPKAELQLCAILGSIADHSLNASHNVHASLSRFFNAWKCQILRSRKKLTYIRLLKRLKSWIKQ